MEWRTYCHKCEIRPQKSGCYSTRTGLKQRYKCSECGTTFSITKETLLYRSHLEKDILEKILTGIMYGDTISQINQDTGIRKATICRWKKFIPQCYKKHTASFLTKRLPLSIKNELYLYFTDKRKAMQDHGYYMKNKKIKLHKNKKSGKY